MKNDKSRRYSNEKETKNVGSAFGFDDVGCYACGLRGQAADSQGSSDGDRKQLHLLRVKQQRNRNRSRHLPVMCRY